jgi:hypothetical protein
MTDESVTKLEDFVRLSEALSGWTGLNQRLAQSYLDRVRGINGLGQHLDDLISVFKKILAAGADINSEIQKQIMADATLGPLARQVIFLWYTSALPSVDGKVWQFGSAEEYFAALLWPTVRAHVPGLSGGYFGHWKYLPDN